MGGGSSWRVGSYHNHPLPGIGQAARRREVAHGYMPRGGPGDEVGRSIKGVIDRLAEQSPVDELMLQRLKKRRLALRDAMARLEAALDPKEPA